MPSATVRQRAESPDARKLAKRHKSSHEPAPGYASCFAEGVLDDATVERLNRDYRQSNPFLHAVVDQLFQDDLLTNVKDECIGELSFTEKQTDIYRVCRRYCFTERVICSQLAGAPNRRSGVAILSCCGPDRLAPKFIKAQRCPILARISVVHQEGHRMRSLVW